jgi:hypothetical protein
MRTILKLVFFAVILFLVSLVCILPEFWLWNALAPKYLTFLPEAWHQIPYKDFLALTWLVMFLFRTESIVKTYHEFSAEVDN